MKKPVVHTPAKKPQTRVKSLGYMIKMIRVGNKRMRKLGHQHSPRTKKGY